MNQFDCRNAYNRAKLALELEHIFKAKARENIVEGGRKGGNIAQGKAPQNSAKALENIETRSEVAKVANISHDTISKVKFIEKDKKRQKSGHP